MGLPIRDLKATNIEGQVLISKWTPEKREDGKYYMPRETPIGLSMWIPNVLGLKEEEGTVDVRIIKATEETGLWLVCFDDYFGNEQHLFDYKPRFKERTKKIDWEYDNEVGEQLSLHVWSEIKMIAGDGPIPVTLERGKYEEKPKPKVVTTKKKSYVKEIILFIVIVLSLGLILLLI